MDNNNSGSASANDTAPRNLTLTMRILMCVAVSLLLFGSVIDTHGYVSVFSFLAVSAANAVLLITADKKKLFIALVLAANLIPFAFAILALKDVVFSLVMLYPILAALPIWLTVMLKKGRTVSVAASAAVTLALFVGIFAIVLYKAFSRLDVALVKELFDQMMEPVAELLKSISSGDADSGISPLMTTAEIDRLIYLYKSVIIGALVSAALVLSYVITLITRLIMKVTSTEHMLPLSERIGIRAQFTATGPKVDISRETVVWRIAPHSVSAWIYIATYLFTFLLSLSDDTLMAWSVAANVQTMLTPVFVYCGARDVILSLRGKATVGRASKLVPILCIIILFLNPSMLTSVLGILGVFVTLRENKAAAMNNNTTAK